MSTASLRQRFTCRRDEKSARQRPIVCVQHLFRQFAKLTAKGTTSAERHDEQQRAENTDSLELGEFLSYSSWCCALERSTRPRFESLEAPTKTSGMVSERMSLCTGFVKSFHTAVLASLRLSLRLSVITRSITTLWVQSSPCHVKMLRIGGRG